MDEGEGPKGTRGLNLHFTVFACKGLRPPDKKTGTGNEGRRERVYVVFIVLLAGLLALVALARPGRVGLAVVGLVVLWRVAGIASTTLEPGLFGIVAGLQVNDRARNVVLVLLHYVEVLLAFATLYLCLERLWPGSIDVPACKAFDALGALPLSMTTQTTVGYGRYAPDSALSLALTTAQALLGLILFAVVSASLLTPPESGD